MRGRQEAGPSVGRMGRGHVTGRHGSATKGAAPALRPLGTWPFAVLWVGLGFVFTFKGTAPSPLRHLQAVFKDRCVP